MFDNILVDSAQNLPPEISDRRVRFADKFENALPPQMVDSRQEIRTLEHQETTGLPSRRVVGPLNRNSIFAQK